MTLPEVGVGGEPLANCISGLRKHSPTRVLVVTSPCADVGNRQRLLSFGHARPLWAGAIYGRCVAPTRTRKPPALDYLGGHSDRNQFALARHIGRWSATALWTCGVNDEATRNAWSVGRRGQGHLEIRSILSDAFAHYWTPAVHASATLLKCEENGGQSGYHIGLAHRLLGRGPGAVAFVAPDQRMQSRREQRVRPQAGSWM